MTTQLLNANVVANIVTSQAITGNLDTILAAIAPRSPVQFTPGSGAGQVSVYWASTRTLTASNSETISLAALTDSLGNAIVIATVKAILIAAASGNTNDVIAFAAASNAWVGPLGGVLTTATCNPGGGILLASSTGWAIDATHKNLKFLNSGAGTSVTYDIIVVGN